MLKELDNYDWQEAFGFAGEAGTCASPSDKDVQSVDPKANPDPFDRESVVKIYAMEEGENDEAPWRIYGKLKDGRYFYLEGGSAWVSSTKKGIEREGLTEEARRIFGLKKDIVGTIKLKEK